MPIVSLRGYSRHREVSLAAIQQAIKAGRIKTSITPEGKIDQEKADLEWVRKSDPARSKPLPDPKRLKSRIVQLPEQQIQPIHSNDGDGDPDFAQSRALKEQYLAQLARLEYETKEGDLLPREDVRQEWSSRTTACKQRFLSIPSKIAAQTRESKSNEEARSIIERAIHEALSELAEDAFQESQRSEAGA